MRENRWQKVCNPSVTGDDTPRRRPAAGEEPRLAPWVRLAESLPRVLLLRDFDLGAEEQLVDRRAED